MDNKQHSNGKAAYVPVKTISEGEQKTKSSGERENWGHTADFLLSLIGYAVGLSNLWRFPYLCMNNGGGAFLIPYFTFLFICGIPLFFLELSLGQFSNLSCIAVWRVSPLFKGLGFGMAIVSGIVCVYYNVIIAWVIYFLSQSFTSKLPWTDCSNAWNTPLCSTRGSANTSQIVWNNSITTQVNTEHLTTTTPSGLSNSTLKLMSPAEEFWKYKVLELSPGIEDLGGVRWELFACLCGAWVIVFLCLIKGIKTSGKVVYVTATVPYIFLLILLIRGLMLPGAIDGVKFYVTPNFEKLKDFKVWSDACVQIFWSLGPAWGALYTYSSYNEFHNNVYRDALLVPIVNCMSSFFAGLVVFSVLGFMAAEVNLPVTEVIESGLGLAFIAYPEALARMPGAPVWAVTFFLVLLTIGLDSQFGMFETTVTGLMDEFPVLRKTAKRKTAFTAAMCTLMLILGIPFVTRGGVYLFQLTDWYCASFSVMVIAFFSCIVIAWIYGAKRLLDEVQLMIGYNPRPIYLWMISWRFITPVLMIVMLVITSIYIKAPQYGSYSYPAWAVGMGWGMAMLSIIPIPTTAIYKIATTQGTLWQRLCLNAHCSPEWGPASDKHKAEYEYHKYGTSCGKSETLEMVPV